MPKRVAEVGEGQEDVSGNGVYSFIRDLIVEGRDARFVNKKGRYVINWSSALKCYTDYKSRRNPQFKGKNINRRKASNGLRAALLNFYKKEGAKEYKDCKKVNDKDEVIERQFQMPPRVFESMFGSVVQLSDDGSEHETSSISSEVDEKPQVTPTSSDTGIDEAMDISDDLFSVSPEPIMFGDLPADDSILDNIKTEEDCVDPSDITTPCQMFDMSEEEFDSALGEICSNSDNDVDLLGVVQDICPSSGSVKGGLQFHITLTEELPDDDKSGIARFDGIGDVYLEKLNPFTLAGTLPAAQQPGPVPITVSTQAGRWLGMTYFMYVDEIQEVLKQLVKDPALQSLYFAMWSQEHGIFGNDSNIAQNLDPLSLQDQGSLIQTKQAQALKVLQLLVYTAAQTDAQQFIQMIFSTSAGKIIFNTYKDRTPLPEDVARANGHDDLAQYLQDVNTRLSKEIDSDAQPSTIDWLELLQAVDKIQKQSSASTEEEAEFDGSESKEDDNQSDYFADVETSSCGSFEFEAGWSDSEDGEGPCSKDESPKKELSKKASSSLEGTSVEVPSEVGTCLGDTTHKKEDENFEEPSIANSKPSWNLSNGYGLLEWLSKWRNRDATIPKQQGTCVDGTQENPSFTRSISQRVTKGGTQKSEDTATREQEAKAHPSQEKTAKKKRHKQGRHWGTETLLKDRRVLLTIALVAVLAGLKIGESQLLHWAVGNGYTGISKVLLKCGLRVDAPNFLRETPLHVAAKNGYKDLADVLIQLGSNVNARNHHRQTPLHLAAWNGHQQTTEHLIKHGGIVNVMSALGQTPLHLAAWKGHLQTTESLIQHGSGVNVQDQFKQSALHFAASNGHKPIVAALIQHGSDLTAQDVNRRTALHLAARNGNKQTAEVLIQHGSNVNARDNLYQTALHLTAENGHKNIADVLIQHGSDLTAQDVNRRTALHLAARIGNNQITEVLIKHGSDMNARDNLQQTPLHLAAGNGHKDIVEILIQHGGNVNVKNAREQTPLHLASHRGHRQTTKFLIQQGGDVKAQDDGKQTALHLAALKGHKNIAEVLIQHGSDINARSDGGKTPLHLAAQQGHQQATKYLIQHGSDVKARDYGGQTALHLAALKGRKNIAEVLIQHGSDINARSDGGRTPLHLAAQQGHQQTTEYLIQHGSDMKARDYGGHTALHLASENGQQEVTEFLIQHGSDVKARSNFQMTALHLAAVNGHKNIAEVLIQHGSDINIRDMVGQTALHLAASRGHQQTTQFLLQHASDMKARDGSQRTALHLAAVNGHKNIAELLIQHGSDVNAQSNFQMTALHLAAVNGHENIAEVLIQHGSDINIRDMVGQTALHLAASRGHQQTTQFLLQHGSDVKIRTGFQRTALHLAVEKSHKNIAELLIQHGSSVNVADMIGWTPLHLAALEGHKQIIKLLLQHRGKVHVADRNGKTPIHFAASKGHIQVIEVLIKHGSDLTYPYDIHRTALRFATNEGYRQITDFLIQYGGAVKALDGGNTTKVQIQHEKAARAKDEYQTTTLHSTAGNEHKNIEEAIQHESEVNSAAVILLHLAAQNIHKQTTDILIQGGSNVKARGDSQQKTSIQTIYAVGMDCAPGTFASDTRCQWCPSGGCIDQFNATKCSQRKRCVGRQNEMTKACSSSSNNECSCQSTNNECASENFRMIKDCTVSSNTEGSPCVEHNTFTNDCILYMGCPRDHIVRQDCTRRTDTVCVPKENYSRKTSQEKDNLEYPRKPIRTSATVTTPPTRNQSTPTKKQRWTSSSERSSIVTISAHNQSAMIAIEDVALFASKVLLVLLVVVLVASSSLLLLHLRKLKKTVTKPGNCEEPSTFLNSTDMVIDDCANFTVQDCYYYKSVLSIPSIEDVGDQRRFQTEPSHLTDFNLTNNKESPMDECVYT
ncbi:uncharacterized protein LOC144638793 isoform X1 [Oculina patagonica]